MPYRCCVPGCHESGNTHTRKHAFPNPLKKPELFRAWIYAVGGELLGLDNHYIYKYRKVCHAHFEIKYCCRFERISNIAVPTLNLPGPVASSLHLASQHLDVIKCRPSQVKNNKATDAPSSSKDSDCNLLQSATQQIVESDNLNPVAGVDSQSALQEMEDNDNFISMGDADSNEEQTDIQYLEEDLNLILMCDPDCITLKSAVHDIEDNAKSIPMCAPDCNMLHSAVQYNEENDNLNVMAPADPLLRGNLEKPILYEVSHTKNFPTTLNGNTTDRILTKHKAHTKTEEELRKELKSLKIKLCKSQRTVKKQRMQLKSAKKISSNPEFVKIMKNWTALAKIFILMQFREHKKKGKGRRFTAQEKIVALTIMKQSATSYRFLRKIFVLPSFQTLQKLQSKLQLNPGTIMDGTTTS